MLAVALTPFIAARRWVRYRNNLAALRKLDDRTLRDIGVLRTAIRHAAWADAR
jgi:uncharacterized protein YjiS (DUF1127 family)